MSFLDPSVSCELQFPWLRNSAPTCLNTNRNWIFPKINAKQTIRGIYSIVKKKINANQQLLITLILYYQMFFLLNVVQKPKGMVTIRTTPHSLLS